MKNKNSEEFVDEYTYGNLKVTISNERHSDKWSDKSNDGEKYDLVVSKNNVEVYTGHFYVGKSSVEVTAEMAFENLLLDMKMLESYIENIDVHNMDIKDDDVIDVVYDISDDITMDANDALQFVSTVSQIIADFENNEINRINLYNSVLNFE